MDNTDALLMLLSVLIDAEGGEYRIPAAARDAFFTNPRALEVVVEDNDDLTLRLVAIPEDEVD